MVQRRITATVDAVRQLEGDGFEVRRPFPSARLELLDPFLLLDHMGPVAFGPGEGVGTPEHPHRGFETVTYLLEGDLEHRDSLGNGGRLGPGDTQWMTAGAGIVHREGPSPEAQSTGGRLHGVQLWVNLPAALKMTPPRYQDVRADRVAVDRRHDGAVIRVIAGEAFGLTGPGSTHTPIVYAHLTLPAGATATTALPPATNAGVYVLSGQVQISDGAVHEGQLAVLGPGDELTLSGEIDAEVLLLAGTPLGEPVARYGPFVMNTRQELIQAMEDYQAGHMGSIPATTA